ncbi:MAG: YIP1 family protein [Salinisphaera sp.]|nr:YIP1 family protein [Salinisphaera sp.]
MADFDFARTQELLKGAALEPEPTWQAYHAQAHDWTVTATLLAGPMIVITAILVPILGWIFGTNMLPGIGGFIAQIILTLIMGLIGLAVSGAVFGLLAGSFGGNSSFDEGFAATSLAAVPAYAGQILGTLPWIGWLLAIALGIYSLVLLYRCLPLFLGIPQEKRIGHFVVGLIVLFVIYVIISFPLAGLLMVGSGMPVAY